MSESYDPTAGGMGGPAPRPTGDGLPPIDGERRRPGAEGAVDTGMEGEGEIGEDTGGMLGEG